jgi:tetratricopeptide (TPR) repeat protein
MQVSQLTDGELFAAWNKILLFGRDLDGSPAGSVEVEEVNREIVRRDLRTVESSELYDQGNGYARSGDFDEATACWLEAIRLSPRYLPAYTNLGGLLTDSGRPYEAVKILQLGAQVGLTFDHAYNLAECFRKLGRFEDALEMIHNAERLGSVTLELCAKRDLILRQVL